MSALSALPEANAKAPTDAPALVIWAGLVPVPQPVLEAITAPELSKTLKLGCARAPETPNPVRAGPSPRASNCSEPVPAITKPGMMILAPVPTRALGEREEED